jgi:hypothetical protein
MKKAGISILVFVMLFWGASGAMGASINLYDWAFHVSGTNYKYENGDTLPGIFDSSSFDFITGLGSIKATITVTGSHTLIAFLDHEIVEEFNTYFNEYGVGGTAASGQSWEIDEPGYVFGNIYGNVLSGALDNTNAVPEGSEDDVSMALGWDFSLAAEQKAIIRFMVSQNMPDSGFYLTQVDPDSDISLYFSSTLEVIGTGGEVPPIPEPSTIFLLGAGLIGLGVAGRKRFFRG